MKKSCLCFLFFFTAHFGQAQDTMLLNVPLKKQILSNWCWAASVEMILSYYSINTTQCDIAKIPYPSTNGNYPSVPCNCGYENDLCSVIINNTGSNWNIRLPVNEERFNPIFAHFLPSYTVYEESTLNWNRLKNNLPAILCLDMNNTKNTLNGRHFVVAKGYREFKSLNTIIINDPWRPCRKGGLTEISSECPSLDTDNTPVRSVDSHVYITPPFIRPTKQPITPSLSFLPTLIVQKIFPDPRIKLNHKLKPRIGSPDPIKIAKDYYRVLVEQPYTSQPYNAPKQGIFKQFRKAELLYFSYKKMASITKKNLLSNPYENIRRLVYSKYFDNSPEILVRNEKMQYCFEAVAHNMFFNSEKKALPQRFEVKVGAKTLQIGSKDYPFVIVVFDEFFYIFRSFKYKNGRYFFAIENYPDLIIEGKPIQPFQAYSYGVFLKALNEKTVKYDQTFRVKYPKGQLYSR